MEVIGGVPVTALACHQCAIASNRNGRMGLEGIVENYASLTIRWDGMVLNPLQQIHNIDIVPKRTLATAACTGQ